MLINRNNFDDSGAGAGDDAERLEVVFEDHTVGMREVGSWEEIQAARDEEIARRAQVEQLHALAGSHLARVGEAMKQAGLRGLSLSVDDSARLRVEVFEESLEAMLEEMMGEMVEELEQGANAASFVYQLEGLKGRGIEATVEALRVAGQEGFVYMVEVTRGGGHPFHKVKVSSQRTANRLQAIRRGCGIAAQMVRAEVGDEAFFSGGLGDVILEDFQAAAGCVPPDEVLDRALGLTV